MSRALKILRFSLILLCIVFATSCASNKNTYYQKRKKASHINTEQLGRNRYFFSQKYQKKLQTNYKKRKVKY